MNQFRQHIPNFVDTSTGPFEHAFATMDELLAQPWIASWRAQPGFCRYSQSPHGDRWLLMAEFDPSGEGRFWVLGYLAQPVEGLPEWVHPDREETS